MTPTTEAVSAPGASVAASERSETPRLRYLIVVARDQPDLWRHLRQSVGEIKGVDVVLDRRHGGRRVYARSWEYEQPGMERRRAADAARWLSCRSVIIVQPESPSPATSQG